MHRMPCWQQKADALKREEKDSIDTQVKHMMQIGRICIKTAGRDAGKKCVIIDVQNDLFVVIDGQTRRRKCNIRHLEPLDQLIDIEQNAPHDAVVSAFRQMGIELVTTKPKENKPAKPVQQRKQNKKPAAEKKEKPKKAAKPAKEPAKKENNKHNKKADKKPAEKKVKKE
jgi:large subunit ribosomal protein L14e